jgi:hypothetical protein
MKKRKPPEPATRVWLQIVAALWSLVPPIAAALWIAVVVVAYYSLQVAKLSAALAGVAQSRP